MAFTRKVRNVNLCGRFYIDETAEKVFWEIVRDVDRQMKLPTVGEIRPSDCSLILRGALNQGIQTEPMNWGFKQVTGSGLIINARAESIMDKPMFRSGILGYRCVVPASWFYEWNKNKERATFRSKKNEPVFMAGIYKRYEEGNRFVILTTAANECMRPVHDRMPVLLGKHEIEDWVFDDSFMKAALKRIPEELVREQEYEQQTFFV